MFKRSRLLRDVFKTDGMLKWYVVHLGTGADHLYVIKEPAADGCLLYDLSEYQKNGDSMFRYDWTKNLVRDYIRNAYAHLNR